MSFGLGVYAPFGLSMKWPEDSGFRSVALDGRVTYLTVQPVVAWRVHPTLSAAAGPTFNLGQTDLKQGLSPFAGNDSFTLKGDAFAPGLGVGVLWQPLEEHSFGVVYRSATTMEDGRYEWWRHALSVSVGKES